MKHKSHGLALIAASITLSAQTQAATYLSDSFNSYSNGDLAGQGSWAQTGTTATTPIQVVNGVASFGTSGQDIYSPLSSIVTPADGTSFYIGLTLNVSAAQSGGDYFLHFAPEVGTSTLFFGRTFVRSSGAGFQLGYLETSGAGGAVAYGTTELSFATDYRVVLAYNRVAGTVNDTASLYVNPDDAGNESNNTPYLTDTWTSASAEPVAIATLNFRQGAAGNAATLTVDNLVGTDTFAEATVVPEPTTAGLVAVGAGLLAIRSRRRRA
jgi:hypothetical protein